MTSSRIVRATKGRIFLYVIAVLCFTGLLACYNSIRVDLEKVQKTYELCQTDQENLATQLQMISDYKQRLEKSLKTEKAEHQQVKAELERRVNEEKLRGEKTAGEATTRFNSLQQQYNILKTDHDDLSEKCSKTQNEQLDEINTIQSKFKELQEQLKQTEREKENISEHLKAQIEQLKNDKINLEKRIQSASDKEGITRLQNELDAFKKQKPMMITTLRNPESLRNVNKTFGNLIPLHNDDYKIGTNSKAGHSGSNNNVADLPSNAGNETNAENLIEDQNQNVLQLPNNANVGIKSSTPNTNVKKSSKASFNLVAPLKVPTVTPESVKSKNSGVSPSKKLPEGVVPPQVLQEPVHTDQSQKDAVADLVNNRYRNVETEEQKKNEIPDKENGANEMLDFPEPEEEDNNNNNNELPKEGAVPKQHIDTLGAGGEKDKAYDGDYEKFAQNDGNMEENEEDDDADEYGNQHLHKDPAVRN